MQRSAAPDSPIVASARANGLANRPSRGRSPRRVNRADLASRDQHEVLRSMTSPDTSLSIVAPCFNEQTVLPEFLARMRAVIDRLGTEYEIILVDDGSTDATWSIIASASATDPRILAIRLRRNHGHQIALTAGIAASRGQLVLLIDADLQDPPELLPTMIEMLETQGADVVYGQRKRRSGETMFKRVTAAAFYRIIAWLSEIEIPRDTGDFRLVTRAIADQLTQMPEHHRFLRGMVTWIGGRQIPLLYVRDPRHAGTSKFSLFRMLRFASDAITGFSRRPLQIATATGILAAFFSVGFGLYSLLGWTLGLAVPGWTSLMAAIGFISALQFFMLGVIGEYLGRLYEESRGRPLFMEAARVGQGIAAGQPTQAAASIAPVLRP
jgi:polyisoprenyl-phosphate glycosyltransferase